MLPTHGDGRSYPRSKPLVFEGDKVSNEFYIMAMLDEEENKTKEWSAKTLATPVNDLPPVTSSVREEIGAVAANNMETQINSGNGAVEKGRPTDSNQSRGKCGAKVVAKLAQKSRTAHHIEFYDVDIPANDDVVVAYDGHMSKGKLITVDKSRTNLDTDDLLFSRSCSSRATGD